MGIIYIQQNSALGNKISYPSSAHPNATIATAGCGVCASLMALENESTYRVSLNSWTNKMLKFGCRAAEGTDMVKTCELLKKYGFQYKLTTSLEVALKHIKKGYGFIANVGGKGYFSSSGHYIYVAGMRKDGRLSVLDPYYYSGKWRAVINGINRAKYFTYNSNTHEVYCEATVVEADRAGYFYLLTPTKKQNKPTEYMKYQNGNYTLTSYMAVRTGAGIKYPQKKFKDLTINAKKNALYKGRNDEAVLKSGTVVTAKIVKVSESEYWMKIPSGYVCLEKGGRVYAK